MRYVAFLAVAFVLCSSAASHAKPWESMNVRERISWAMKQVPRLCPGGIARMTSDEKAQARALIAQADQATVVTTILGRCNSSSASRY